MSKPKKILFLSAPIGSGHTRAAHAVNKALLQQTNQLLESRVLEISEFVNPFTSKMFFRIYLQILGSIPEIYGRIYDWGNKSLLAQAGTSLINNYLAKKINSYIEVYDPALIVCSHATPAGIVAQLRAANKLKIPAVAIITDFVVHRLWLHSQICRYYVATSEMCDSMTRYGIRENDQVISGIPVAPEFATCYDKHVVRRHLGFAPNIPTVLIMGGGTGIFPIGNIVELINNLNMPIQIIAVTGNNTTIFQKLHKMKNKLKYPCHCFGYVNNIHELMAASDLLISKSGGLTCAEALCQGLPMVIFRPIPGQEAANANYLVKHNVAWRVDDFKNLHIMLNAILIQNPKILRDYGDNARLIAQPNAAKKIAASLMTICS